MCVCVCVFFPSILDIKFVGRTSRGHTGGRSHRIFNPPSFCGACLDFCREKDSAIPFPRLVANIICFVVVVVVFTLKKAVPISTQYRYFLTSVLVQLMTRTPFPWSQANYYPERVQISEINKRTQKKSQHTRDNWKIK